MKKVKITVDKFTAELLLQFFTHLSSQPKVVPGLELEHLVILNLDKKNYLKTRFETEYKLTLQPHEALSMHRILFSIGLADPMAANTRDLLCDQIAKQCSASYWPKTQLTN